jgi:hypothetical protein
MGMEASPHATVVYLSALWNSDLRDDLSRVNAPTVIFHSTQDKICPFELAEAMAVGIKGARLIREQRARPILRRER